MSTSQPRVVSKENKRRKNPNLLTPATTNLVVTELLESLSSSSVPRGTESGAIRLQYLKDAVWTKYADVLPNSEYVSPDDRKQLAVAKWQLAEYRNAKTNNRLLEPGIDFGYFRSDRVLEVARGFIASVLGKTPPRLILGEFTGGSSTRIKRSEIAIPQKFEGRQHATLEASHWWGGLALAFPLWGLSNSQAFNPEIVPGSVMFTVPKNSRIDRVACKEPEVNMFLQRGLGLFIRKRLKKVGIDLQDQTRNQGLVVDGAKRGLATIDLSSASDTISRELVRTLLPDAWYSTLDAVRVKEVTVPGSNIRHRLEMFSSMGNGFTFELESLIFWALTRSLCYLLRAKGTISVYGDDIICPTKAAKLLPRVFAYFGFTVNTEKSCISGPLRESCGAHYYGTQDVTPFYIRQAPEQITDLIQIGNQLMSWMLLEEYSEDIPSSFAYLWGFLASLIPAKFHGGQSLERTDALVTGHGPRKLLCRKASEVDIPQMGGYLWWHLGKQRTPDQVFSPTDSTREGGWTVRSNRSWRDESLLYDVGCKVVSFFDRLDR